MIRMIDNFINNLRKESEERRYLNQYHVLDPIYIDEITGYKIIDGYHVIIFMSQEYMLSQGMLEEQYNGSGRIDMSTMFDQWLKESVRGFHQVWQWGNGYGNLYQKTRGIWHMQIWCAREEDAMAIKLRWF